MATRIMIVEDEAVVRLHLLECLTGFGYDIVAQADTGREAILLAPDVRPDLILMDIRLADEIDGIEAACRIHDQIDIPIVFLTAFADLGTIERTAAAGAYGYLVKPFEEAAVRATIETALARYHMDTVAREDDLKRRNLLRSMGEAVLSTDTRGQVIFANATAERLLGLSGSELIGRPLTEVMPLTHADGCPALIADLAGQQSAGVDDSSQGTVWLEPAAGPRRWVRGSINPILTPTGEPTGVVVCFRDAGEQDRLVETVRQAQLWETLSHLAASVAHGFNNVLTVILGGCEQILSGSLSQDRILTLVRGIQDAGEQAALLAQHFQAFAPGPDMTPEPLEINTFLTQLQPMLERFLGPRVRLRIEALPAPAYVRCTARVLKHILFQLANNAHEAMPEGGDLTLEASTATQNDQSDCVSIVIRDTGTGISPDVRGRLFEPFVTTKTPSVGKGLGLASVQATLRGLGGTINILSTTPMGTTIQIVLPEVLAASAPAPQETPSGPPVILVVDDEPGIRLMVQATLAPEGYRILEAESAEDAWDLAQSPDVRLDLLLTDVMLPGMKGTELAERLRAVRPELHVIVMSGYAGREPATLSIPQGEWLAKPFSLKDLKARVAAILGESTN